MRYSDSQNNFEISVINDQESQLQRLRQFISPYLPTYLPCTTYEPDKTNTFPRWFDLCTLQYFFSTKFCFWGSKQDESCLRSLVKSATHTSEPLTSTYLIAKPSHACIKGYNRLFGHVTLLVEGDEDSYWPKW